MDSCVALPLGALRLTDCVLREGTLHVICFNTGNGIGVEGGRRVCLRKVYRHRVVIVCLIMLSVNYRNQMFHL
jgi:hypothetical protein